MAKSKHENATNDQPLDNGATASAPYVLDPQRWEPVLSRIYTLKLDTADGKYDVDKARLVKTVTSDDGKVTSEVYRYQRRVAVPAINEAAITDADSLAREVLMFAQNIEAYDNATELSNELIKKDGTETKMIQRPVRVAVNSKGEPISSIEYVRKLLVDANTLAIQKQLQKDLRDRADTEMMAELADEGLITPPSPTAKKVKAATSSADAADAFDTL